MTTAINPSLLDASVHGSFAEEHAFPHVVETMRREGVEWYSANLLFGASTFYLPDGRHHQTRWADWTVPPIADAFDGPAVLAAVRDAQAGRIGYPEFLRRVAAAGTVYYTVHIAGRQVRYHGRHGDVHVELFPPDF